MTDPDIFNLIIAAKVRCRVAMIRIDYIIWADSGFTKLVPRIASRLITVRQTMRNPAMPIVCYMVSIGGMPFFNPKSKPETMSWLLRRADFAQIFVPTDYSDTELPDWEVMGQPGAIDGVNTVMTPKKNRLPFMFEKKQFQSGRMLKPHEFYNK